MSQINNSPTLAKIVALRSTMTKSEKLVADTILDDPASVIHSSVAEIAWHSNVSEPTVIRACRRLGLSGYQDLKIALARELVDPIQFVDKDISSDDDIRTVSVKTFQSTISTLQSTLDTLNFDDMQKALDMISAARRIAVIGFGNSEAMAIDLQHKLMRVGKNASAYPDPYMAAIAITGLEEGDVLFCISHSGSSKDGIKLAMQARDKGIEIISICSTGVTPLSKLSTVTLHTSSPENSFRVTGLSSRIAVLSIIDCLHSMLAINNKEYGRLSAENAIKNFTY